MAHQKNHSHGVVFYLSGTRNETPISQSKGRSSSGETVRGTVSLLRRESLMAHQKNHSHGVSVIKKFYRLKDNPLSACFLFWSLPLQILCSLQSMTYFLTIQCKTVKMKEPNISQLNIFPLVTYAIFISIDKNACSYLHTN